MLRLKEVQVVFNPGQINENNALENINLTVNAGDFITIIGSNGAGKSTLLNVIAGMVPVAGGEITLEDFNITNISAHKRARWIGRVFQDPLLGTAGSMTIEENLSLARRRGRHRRLVLGVNKQLRHEFERQLALLDLGLESRLHESINLLSGGQRQALTLLMAIMGQPKILLLDEHIASLDPQTATDIIALTTKIIAEEHLTALMVTHDMYQALEMGNRTIMMDKGEVIFDIKDPARSQLSVNDLLRKFAEVRGKELADDRLLLG